MGSTTHTRRLSSRDRSSSVSSDNQPASGAIVCRRSRSKWSTSMSASDTGESLPLVQCLSALLNVVSARSPAARTAWASAAAISARSEAGNGQSLDPDRRRVGSVAEFEIVGGHERRKDLIEMARDRDLAHRIGELAALDPETRRAAAVVAGHHIDAHPNEVGDVEPVGNVFDQFPGGDRAGREVEIGWCWRGGCRDAAAGMSGGFEAELARRRAIEDPGFQHTVLDQRAPLAGDAFGVKRVRAEAALAQRVIDDVDAGPEDVLPELVFQEAGTASDRGPIDGGCQVSNERARDPRFEYDRHLPGRDLARVEPARRPFAGRASDRFGLLEIGGVNRRRKIVIALHAGALAGNSLHGDAVT